MENQPSDEYVIPEFTYSDDSEIKEDFDELIETVESVNKKRDSGKGISQVALEIYQKKRKLSNVYHSAAIEGNNLTLQETEIILAGTQVRGKPLKDELESKSLGQANEFLYKLISGEEEINKRTLRDLHSLIIPKEVDSSSGSFRKTNVKINKSDHVPPDHNEIDRHINQLFKYINRNSHKMDPLEMAVRIHHWLVWIHPFKDGNGRVTRMFTNFYLTSKGYPDLTIKVEDRETYYDALVVADKESNLNDLLALFIKSSFPSIKLLSDIIDEESRKDELALKMKNYGKTKSLEHFESQQRKYRTEYEVWKGNIQIFYERFKSVYDLVNENFNELIECRFQEYEMITFDQYLSFLEGKVVNNTRYFRMGLFSKKDQNKKIELAFQFKVDPRAFQPLVLFNKPVYKDGQIVKRSGNFLSSYDIIKLEAYPKREYDSEGKGLKTYFKNGITLRNVGSKKDTLTFGVVARINNSGIPSLKTLEGKTQERI